MADSFYATTPLVIAHRGARDVAPENTLAAFEAAIEADADGIELDVARCATGEIVVIHDDTLDRTTNGSGAVAETPFYTLRALDAGAWFGPAFAGQRVPTLQEVLDLFGHRVRINIEIKGRALKGDGIEDEIAEMVEARKLRDEVIISSFNPAALLRMRRAAPDLRRALLYAPDMPLYLAQPVSAPLVWPNALHPHFSQVNAAMLRAVRQLGLRVNVWTVNDCAEMERLITLGVDGIITDHPAQLRTLLRSRPIAS